MENKKFEIGQKTLQTDTQIVVISFFRFKGSSKKFGHLVKWVLRVKS